MKYIGFAFLLLINLSQSVHAIDPDREYIRTPDAGNWPYEALKITTEDKIKLNTWIYEADKTKNKNTVIVLAYPDAGNMSYFVYHAWIMAKAGYTVVTFDYRGFGKSDDFTINKSALYHTEFITDLTAIVDNIYTRFQDKKIGIWAMSMGSIITSRAYPSIKGKIDFIIGEGYVTDTSAIIDKYQAQEKHLDLPEASGTYMNSIQSINIPMLIFTASEDTITTHEDALKLKDKLGDTCHIIQYQAAHLQGFQYLYESKGFGGWYMEQIDAFIKSIS